MIALDVAPLVIYPNPADEEITIQLPKVAEQETTLTITDALGRVIVQQRLNTGESSRNISTKALTAGIYFLRIQTKDTIVKQKIVIAHSK